MVLCWRRHGRAGGCRITYGGVAQLGEHLPCKQGVMSSNLTISTLAMRSGNLKSQTGVKLACKTEWVFKFVRRMPWWNKSEGFMNLAIISRIHCTLKTEYWKILKYQEVCKCKREINKTSEADFERNRKLKQTKPTKCRYARRHRWSKQKRKRLFADLKVLLITFASQMTHQIYNHFLTSELVRSSCTSDDRLLSYLVKLIRAQGGCLGTKSRRKTW